MKGYIKITIEEQDETGAFPIKNTYIIHRDNTFESIEEWVDVFKKILYLTNYSSELIEEIFKS